MIQLNDVSIFVTATGRELVGGLSFTLNTYDRTVLIGEEGNGKSTLLKLIYDPALIADHAEYTGLISRGRHKLGYLSQEATQEENASPIREYLGLGEEELWRAEALASECELEPSLVRA